MDPATPTSRKHTDRGAVEHCPIRYQSQTETSRLDSMHECIAVLHCAHMELPYTNGINRQPHHEPRCISRSLSSLAKGRPFAMIEMPGIGWEHSDLICCWVMAHLHKWGGFCKPIILSTDLSIASFSCLRPDPSLLFHHSLGWLCSPAAGNCHIVHCIHPIIVTWKGCVAYPPSRWYACFAQIALTFE